MACYATPAPGERIAAGTSGTVPSIPASMSGGPQANAHAAKAGGAKPLRSSGPDLSRICPAGDLQDREQPGMMGTNPKTDKINP